MSKVDNLNSGQAAGAFPPLVPEPSLDDNGLQAVVSDPRDRMRQRTNRGFDRGLLLVGLGLVMSVLAAYLGLL